MFWGEGAPNRYVLLVKAKAKSHPGLIVYSWNMMLTLILSSTLAGNNLLTFSRNLALSTLSMLAVVFSVYIYNDITDIEIDRLNNLDRPLATGEASKKDARNVVILLAVAGLTVASLINITFFLLLLTYYVLFFSYSLPSIHLKKKLLIKDLTIATGAAITSLLGGATVGLIPPPVFYLAALAFVGSMTMTPLKDLRDLKGDKIHKIRTIPIVWGPKITVRLSISIVFLMAIATVIGYLHLGFNQAFIVIASVAFAAWLYVLHPLSSRWQEYVGKPTILSLILKKMAPIVLSLEIITIFAAVL